MRLPRELTICTFSTVAHEQVLGWNLLFSGALNETAKPKWLVTELDSFHCDDLSIAPPEPRNTCEILPPSSVRLPLALFNQVTLLKPPPKEEVEAYAQSTTLNPERLFRFTQALSFEKALKRVKTRYALILDPGFFLVKPNWTTEIPAYMQERELDFFGAPWHPRWFQKWRKFPGMECCFVDLQKDTVRPGDLKPELAETATSGSPFWAKFIRTPGRLRRYALLATHWKHALAEEHLQRASIDCWKGMGHRIFDRRKSLSVESVIPVFDPLEDGFLPQSVTPFQLKYLPGGIEKSYAKDLQATRLSFGQLGLPDLRKRGWEEYFWRGNPFGFQLRAEEHWSSKGTFADKHLGRALDAMLTRLGKRQIESLRKDFLQPSPHARASGPTETGTDSFEGAPL